MSGRTWPWFVGGLSGKESSNNTDDILKGLNVEGRDTGEHTNPGYLSKVQCQSGRWGG